MALIYDGTSGITFNDGSQIGSASQMGIRNKIINGHMIIDQRSAGANTVITDTSGTLKYNSIDRFGTISTSASGPFAIGQNLGSATPPSGYTNYLGIKSLAAFNAVPGTDYYMLEQRIEGYNIYDLDWGKSTAKSVTLSFWVQSSLTGTFGGALQNSAQNRSYPFTYTINSANTWQQIIINIPGDTTGTWLTNSGIGISVIWGLNIGYSALLGTAGAWAAADYRSATGSTNVLATYGATFYITGVQLEKGSVATPFDLRLYSKELLLCQRYFIKYGGDKVYQHIGIGSGTASTSVQADTVLPVTMRVPPSATQSTLGVYDMVGSTIPVTGLVVPSSGNENGTNAFSMNYIVASGITTYRPYVVLAQNSTSAYLWLNAEL